GTRRAPPPGRGGGAPRPRPPAGPAHVRRRGRRYAGVEALAELEDLSRAALKRYPELRGEHARWVLIEATDRLLPEIDPSLAEYAHRRLTRRAIEIKMSTRLDSAENGIMRL